VSTGHQVERRVLNETGVTEGAMLVGDAGGVHLDVIRPGQLGSKESFDAMV
jgi:hypothetical protein